MKPLTFAIDHDIDRVYTALTDPGFVEARCLDIGADKALCEVSSEGDHIVVRTEVTATRDPDKVPKLVRRFAGQHTVVIEERWWADGDGKAGSMSAGPDNMPMHMEADRRLQPSGNGCRLDIELRCRVGIPFVGSRLERMLLDKRATELAMEIDYLQQKLGVAT